jgi:transposase-like protein
MSIEIDGVAYFSAADVKRDLGVARQTLWRWRRAQKVPQGRRYRDRQVLFTADELEAIREYANRLEPAEVSNGASNQLKLFHAKASR